MVIAASKAKTTGSNVKGSPSGKTAKPKKLSAKAKGKQRATEELDINSNSDLPPPSSSFSSQGQGEAEEEQAKHLLASSSTGRTSALDQHPSSSQATTSNDYVAAEESPPQSSGLPFPSTSQIDQCFEGDGEYTSEPSSSQTSMMLQDAAAAHPTEARDGTPTQASLDGDGTVIADSQDQLDQSDLSAARSPIWQYLKTYSDDSQHRSSGMNNDGEISQSGQPPFLPSSQAEQSSQGGESGTFAETAAAMLIDEKFESDIPASTQASVSAAEPRQTTMRRFLTVPRVIPLHGTLAEMHCPKCTHIEPLEKYMTLLASGNSVHCPQCLVQDSSRTALGERSRGVGVLKVSVVLYGEEHKQATRVGEIAEKDLLKSARPDILIVAGTTLKIPGVKKLVKELSKVVKQEIEEQAKDAQGNPTGEYVKKNDPSRRVIFVNQEGPIPEKTWENVFDTFVKGDAQTFAKMVRDELKALKEKPIPLPIATIKKKATAAPKQQQQTSLTSLWNVTKSADLVALDKPSHPMALSNMLNRPVKTKSSSKAQPKHADRVQQKKKKSIEGEIAAASASGKEGRSNKVAQRKKPNRKPAKKIAPQAKVVPEEKPKLPKEKIKPGWKGWALADAADPPKPKFGDYWTETVTGPRRRGSPNQTSSSQFNLVPALHTAVPVTTIVEVLQEPHPSTASTPPSLFSDMSTVSDDELRLLHQEDLGQDLAASSSTQCVSDSQPDANTMKDELPCSSEQLQLASSSSVIIVEDSQDPSLRSLVPPSLDEPCAPSSPCQQQHLPLMLDFVSNVLKRPRDTQLASAAKRPKADVALPAVS